MTTRHQNDAHYLSSSARQVLAVGVFCAAVAVAGEDPNNFHNNTRIYTLNHCQVPCGIFNDPAMVEDLKQACLTIRKAIVQSNELHGNYVDTTPLNANQFIRWIMTKEEHANKIISTVSDYCLCQRVKRGSFATEADYLNALKIHHVVMQAAMKAKQSMDIQACEALEHAVADLAKMYTPVVATQL